MKILVDPNTGQKWEFPDDQADAAQAHLNWSTPEQYAEQQRQEQLQAEHGGFGEQLQTAAEEAGRTLAGQAAQLGSLLGTVTGAPSPTAQEIAPELYSPGAQARQEANPHAAIAGKLAGELPAYALLGGAASAVGGAAAGALGASEALGAASGLAAESAAAGAYQEQQAAIEESRPLDSWNVAKNGLINLAFGSVLPIGGALYRRAFGGSALEQAVAGATRSVARAGEDLADPAVASEYARQLSGKLEDTSARIRDAVESYKPPVARDLQAQRDAIQSTAQALRDADPDAAQALDDMAGLSSRQAFARLQELAAQDLPQEAADHLNELVRDRSLWGDQAVKHLIARESLASAVTPDALADAARSVDDPAVQELVAQLDSHVDDMRGLQAREVFAPSAETQSTVGAAHIDYDQNAYDKARTELVKGAEDAPTIAAESDAIYHQASQNTTRALDTLDSVMKNELSVSAKYDDWKIAAEQWTPKRIAAQDRWIAERMAQADEVANSIGELAGKGFDSKSYGANAQAIIRDYATRIAGAANPLERAKIAENLKRRIDYLIGRLGKLPEGSLETPIKSELVQRLRPLADDLRRGFEDPALFGAKVARYQAQSNAGWHKLIDPLARIQQALTERTGFEWGEVGQQAFNRRAVEQKAEAQMRAQLGGGVNFQEDLKEALDGIEQIIEAKEKHGITNLGRLKEARTALQSIRDDQDLASVLRVAVEQSVAHGHGHITGGFAGAGAAESMAASIGGHVIDAMHPGFGRLVRYIAEPAAARWLTKARKALGLFTPPELGAEGSALRQVFEQHAQRYARSLSDLTGTNMYATETLGRAPTFTRYLKRFGGSVALGGVAALAANGQASAAEIDQRRAQYLEANGARDTIRTARAMTDPEYAARAAKGVAEQPSTLEQFQGEHATLQQAFSAQRAAVERMARDPGAIVDALADNFGHLDPRLRDALVSRAVQVSSYLQSQLPPRRGVSAARPMGLPPSTLEARAYALKHMTALAPQTAFDDAKRGMLRHEQVDALQATWPELYSELRSQVLISMGDGHASIAQRQRADLLFGFGAALDPAFGPAIVVAAEQGRQQAQAPGGAPSSAPVSKLPTMITPKGIQALQH